MHKVSIHIHIMWICIHFCVEFGTTFLWGIPNSEPMEGPPSHPPYVLIIYRETQSLSPRCGGNRQGHFARPQAYKMAICYTLQSMKLGMDGPPMAPHGLIFSEDGATPSNMLSIWLPALYEAIYNTPHWGIGVRG